MRCGRAGDIRQVAIEVRPIFLQCWKIHLATIIDVLVEHPYVRL